MNESIERDILSSRRSGVESGDKSHNGVSGAELAVDARWINYPPRERYVDNFGCYGHGVHISSTRVTRSPTPGGEDFPCPYGNLSTKRASYPRFWPTYPQIRWISKSVWQFHRVTERCVRTPTLRKIGYPHRRKMWITRGCAVGGAASRSATSTSVPDRVRGPRRCYTAL